MTESAMPVLPKPGNLDRHVIELMQTMGQSLNMSILYGVSHKVAHGALERSYPVVRKFIEEHNHIHFNISEGKLLINGVATDGAPLATPFASRITGLNLLSFTLEPGFTFEEYLSLFSLLMTPPAKLAGTGKTSTELIASMGLQHVQTTAFTYRRVAEDAPGNPPTPPEVTDTVSGGDADGAAQPDVNNIMAFLKDEPGADTARSAEDIRQLANDPEKLAELILRTVEIRSHSVTLEEGESLSDLVVGCIRKVVDQVAKDPSAKTQKGRKQVKRSLLMLEKTLLDRLQSISGEDAAQAVESLINEVTEDLDLDALAGNFMKSHKATLKAKTKLSRLIDRVQDDPAQLEELHEKLTQDGLSSVGWRELTLRKQQDISNPQSTGMGEGANEIRILTLLLARLGETISQTPNASATDTETIKSLVSETGSHLAGLTQITGRKIDDLQNKLEQEAPTPPLSRTEILRILAEIAQEISQPLTIINGTVTLIRSLRAGPLSAPQGELLSMVSESGRRMEQLVSSLARIAGVPDELEPDQSILSAAYSDDKRPHGV